MVQDFTAFRKISFQTVDVEVALAEIEYQYLKFICEATLRNSDEVLREQIRHLQIAGLPSFDDWRKQEIATVQGILSPSIEAKTIPTTAIESNDSATETIVEPQPTRVEPQSTSDRTPAEPPASKASQTKAKSPEATSASKTTESLLQKLAEPATAQLTSREVIEQQHQQLSILLKEGKTMDDLAALLTSNGAKISTSTLRNYLSAARRKAKADDATVAKKTAKKPASVAAPSAVDTLKTTDNVVEKPSTTAQPSTSETATDDTTSTATKPTKGSSKAAAKSKLERETSVTSSSDRKQPSPLDVSPVPRRRRGRI